MTLFEAIHTHSLLYALGWTLLHFMWQGALVAILLSGALTLLRGQAANIRYTAGCAALALMLVFPAITFLRTRDSSTVAEVDETTLRTTAQLGMRAATAERVERSSNLLNAAPARTGYENRRARLTERLEFLLPWLILTWLLGVLGLTARVIGGLMYAHRLTRRRTLPLSFYWQERLIHLSEQLRVTKTVRLVESSLVRVPTAVGWLRPVILLPPSALVGLTPQQLELILAHELAHIRRYDYLINLLQVVAETLLFYHPAVWWVSRQIRIEREHACDDLAVAMCGDAVAYARALTKLERLRKNAPVLAVAANGGKLSERIGRLIGNSPPASRASFPLAGMLFIAALFITVACARNVLSHKKQVVAVAVKIDSSSSESTSADGPRDSTEIENQSSSSDVASQIANDDITGEDAEVRQLALAALGARSGTLIVMNPKTGRVFTVVNQEWALRRGWNPASTIKLVTGLAGIEERVFDPTKKISVSTQAESLDLTRALALSNNLYFTSLGERIGTERLLEYARRLGLGERTGINFENETTGYIPPFRADTSARRVGASGGGMQVTPIQLATLVSAIANGGTLVTPRVPRTTQEADQFAPQFRRSVGISRETLQRLVPGMIATVEYGTGKAAFDPTQRVAGKTGTFIDDKTPVGIFASYAPADDPRTVVVVLTRGRNESGAVAAGVAGTIYRALNRRL